MKFDQASFSYKPLVTLNLAHFLEVFSYKTFHIQAKKNGIEMWICAARPRGDIGITILVKPEHALNQTEEQDLSIIKSHFIQHTVVRVVDTENTDASDTSLEIGAKQVARVLDSCGISLEGDRYDTIFKTPSKVCVRVQHGFVLHNIVQVEL